MTSDFHHIPIRLKASNSIAMSHVSFASTPPVATNDANTTQERHFLSQWFQVLKNRVLVSDRHALDPHNVRVEASGTMDWWIQVLPPAVERCAGCGFYATHEPPSQTEQIAQLRELREALVLLSMYAQLDYDSWLDGMKRTSGLRFRHSDQLLSRFSFVVSESTTPDGSYPNDMLGSVFGSYRHVYSDEFMRDYELLMAQAEAAGIPIDSMFTAPIALRLEFSQLGGSSKYSADTLRTVADTITLLSDTKNQVLTFPSFQLDCVELRLRRHELQPATFDAIASIVDTGVAIQLLELPGRLEEPIDHDSLHAAWSLLARKLFRPANETGVRLQIERLELPPVYFATGLAAAWLPLLTTASNIRSLTIHAEADPVDATPQSNSSLAWMYLAYAMFTCDANNSIESLHLDSLGTVEMDEIASMEMIAGSTTPLVDLWRVVAGQPQGFPTTLASADEGVAKALSVSSPTTTSRSGLRRLILSHRSLQGGENAFHVARASFVGRLLRFAGPQLTALAIDGAQLDDDAVRQCLDLCPALQSLRLNGATLKSMDIFLGLDMTPASRLTSLDLRSTTTSKDALHTFLKTLAISRGTTTAARGIERFRIGKQWRNPMDASTCSVLDATLAMNQSLAYLHVVYPNDPVFATTPNGTKWNQLKHHDGKRIASRDCALPLENKLAFLASSIRVSSSSHVSLLNQDVLTHIFQFAATLRQRTVVVEADQPSVMY